jgi:hypothetical protein
MQDLPYFYGDQTSIAAWQFEHIFWLLEASADSKNLLKFNEDGLKTIQRSTKKFPPRSSNARIMASNFEHQNN